ncbi:MAG: hypothetical protein J5808_03620 [Paludibacteraceae bacterium]|nr:hypothetical protein [Paludibacteraceae bacterium]
MRRNVHILCLLLFLLPACTSDEPQEAGEVGTVTLNRTRIGLGQPVEATVVETKTPEGSLTQRTMRWLLNDKQLVSDNNVFRDGTFYRTFQPDRLGENHLKFLVSYVFLKSSGRVTQTLMNSAETTFVVEPCDVRTSFWGDSQELCIYNEVETRLAPSTNNPNILQSVYEPLYERPAFLSYYFEQDSLTRVEQREIVAVTSLADHSQFFNAYIKGKDAIDIQYNDSVSASIEAVYNGASDDVIEAWVRVYDLYLAGTRTLISYDDQRMLGTAIYNGTLQLRANYTTVGNTIMQYRAESSSVSLYGPAVFLTQDFCQASAEDPETLNANHNESED